MIIAARPFRPLLRLVRGPTLEISDRVISFIDCVIRMNGILHIEKEGAPAEQHSREQQLKQSYSHQ